jgi:lysophospholipase L1-like esterase
MKLNSEPLLSEWPGMPESEPLRLPGARRLKLRAGKTAVARRPLTGLLLGVLALGVLLGPASGRAAGETDGSFYLKDGDTVCFYGDSITEQRFYGMDVEAYVRTRFPHLHVKFVNSGVGGDRVTGGWAGKIDLRLERDVFPFKPNVVTIMLGMNDASYRAFDGKIFGVYTNGYEHIIQSLQEHLPGVRIVLIEPSPFDDVTESPRFPGGYNGVLLRYSAFVRDLAAEHHLACVDLNGPLVEVMKKARAEDLKLSHQVIPGRVHPSAAGELVMAQGILQAWKAPATVTSVAIDAGKSEVAHADNTTVSGVRTDAGTLSWTQNDRRLPFPILALHDDWWQFPPVARDWGSLTFFTPAPKPKWDHTNAATALILRCSDFYQALDQEPLRVSGLRPGHYRLTINDQAVGEFSAQQLGEGVNLAAYRTPMLEQSYHVLDLVWKQVAWRFFAWRGIQTQLSFDHDPAVQEAARQLIGALEAQKEGIEEQQYSAAQPQPTHYQLNPATQ